MTREQFAALLNEIQDAECAVRVAGQKEYAHDNDNAFANFERIGRQLGIAREKILWVYLIKHMDGILAYLNGHKSQREDIRGRIKDARMYLALLWGMIEEGTTVGKTPESFYPPLPAKYDPVIAVIRELPGDSVMRGDHCGIPPKTSARFGFDGGPEIHGDPQYTRPGESEE